MTPNQGAASLVERLTAGGDDPIPLKWTERTEWLLANWALRTEAASTISQLEADIARLRGTGAAARENFLTMQGAAASLLKRATRAEEQLKAARANALEEAAKLIERHNLVFRFDPASPSGEVTFADGATPIIAAALRALNPIPEVGE